MGHQQVIQIDRQRGPDRQERALKGQAASWPLLLASLDIQTGSRGRTWSWQAYTDKASTAADFPGTEKHYTRLESCKAPQVQAVEQQSLPLCLLSLQAPATLQRPHCRGWDTGRHSFPFWPGPAVGTPVKVLECILHNTSRFIHSLCCNNTLATTGPFHMGTGTCIYPRAQEDSG